jgi:hypothetical protein
VDKHKSIDATKIDWVRRFLWHWRDTGIPEQVAAQAIITFLERPPIGEQRTSGYLSQDPVAILKGLDTHWR